MDTKQLQTTPPAVNVDSKGGGQPPTVQTTAPSTTPPVRIRGGQTRKRFLSMTRRADALRLRMAGCTYQEIADALKFRCRQGAHKAVESALRDIPKPNVEEVRKLENERLDQMTYALAKQVAAGNHQAIDRWLRIMERRAKMNGVDQPIKIIGEGFTEKNIIVVQHAHETVPQRSAAVDAARLVLASGGNGHEDGKPSGNGNGDNGGNGNGSNGGNGHG